MTELQISRWFENPEPTDLNGDEATCLSCGYLIEECECIDDWKLAD